MSMKAQRDMKTTPSKAAIAISLSLLTLAGCGSTGSAPQSEEPSQQEIMTMFRDLIRESDAASSTGRTATYTDVPPQEPEGDWVGFSGIATAKDTSGTVHAECDGFLRVILHDQWGSSPATLPVRRGAFQLKALPETNLELVSLVLDGLWVELPRGPSRSGRGIQGGALIALPEDGRIELQGDWPKPVEVTVLGPRRGSLRSERLIAPITVNSIGWDKDRTSPVTQLILQDVESPFELPIAYHPALETLLRDPPKATIDAVYWISAPGYEWAQLIIDLRRGGDVVLHLLKQS